MIQDESANRAKKNYQGFREADDGSPDGKADESYHFEYALDLGADGADRELTRKIF